MTEITSRFIFSLFVIYALACTSVQAGTLDLTSGNTQIVGANSVTFQNLSVDDRFYNATIQLNLDGTYNITTAEQVIISATATYEVRFDSTWSVTTHPHEYPGGLAHFSGLIGATHKGNMLFWQRGNTASPGMEHMAELGSKSPLREEIETAIDSGNAQYLLSGGGLSRSPGSVTLQFEISQSYPFLTLVSMIAPSPDWFIGISALSLIENGQWLDQLVVPLYAYDNGTDSGVSYTSPNSDTPLNAPISRLEELPFLVNGQVPPLGSFTFTRLPR